LQVWYNNINSLLSTLHKAIENCKDFLQLHKKKVHELSYQRISIELTIIYKKIISK